MLYLHIQTCAWRCVPFVSHNCNLLEMSEVPQIVAGYFATFEEPLQILRCRPDAWCPGGTPGWATIFCFLSLLQVDFYQETCTCSISMLWRSMSIFLLEGVEAFQSCFPPLSNLGWNPWAVASPVSCMCRNLRWWFGWSSMFSVSRWASLGGRKMRILPILHCSMVRWSGAGFACHSGWLFSSQPHCNLDSLCFWSAWCWWRVQLLPSSYSLTRGLLSKGGSFFS